MEKYVIAYDLGTKSNKAVIFDSKLNVISQASEKYPIFYPKKGWAEQNPIDYWNSVVNTTQRLIQNANIKKDEITALTFDCQMNCTIPIDSDGNPLMNSISWLDTRAASITHQYKKGLVKVSGYGLKTALKFLTITGGAPGFNGKDPISHIIWIKENEPEIYKNTYKFLSVKDYVIYKCTGNAVVSRDLGNTSWLMDSKPKKFIWSPEILEKFNIEKEKLPIIKKSSEQAGMLTKNAAAILSLNPDIPVFVGSGDITASALGSGAIQNNQIIVCLGTADWIGAHLSKRKKDIKHYLGAICSAQENYLCLSKQETGAACLDWVIEQFFRDEINRFENKPSDLYHEIDSIVKKTSVGSKGLIFTPWMFGERSPINDSQIRGGFYNVALNHDRNDILRSVFEGIVYNIRWGLFYVEKLVGKSENINFVGGGANSEIWCQILADILDRNINQMKDASLAGAKGSAIVALVGLGKLKSFLEAAPLVKINKTFEPNPDNKKVYNSIYEEYVKIYERNKEMFKVLNP